LNNFCPQTCMRFSTAHFHNYKTALSAFLSYTADEGFRAETSCLDIAVYSRSI
jgi:hypothetical protein